MQIVFYERKATALPVVSPTAGLPPPLSQSRLIAASLQALTLAPNAIAIGSTRHMTCPFLPV